MNNAKLTQVTNALSKSCRFGGDVKRFYSVAEHTVHMVRQADEDGLTPDMQLLMWLHDCPEYVVGDLLPLVKKDKEIAPLVVPLERRVMENICFELGVSRARGLVALHNTTVKEYDRAVLCAEAKLIAAGQPAWKPYDAGERLHVAFHDKIRTSAPYAENFRLWAANMVYEFERITGEMS